MSTDAPQDYRLTDLEHTASSLSGRVSRLASSVEDIERGLEDARRELRNLAELPTTVDRLDRELRETQDSLQNVQDELSSDLSAESRARTRLATRIEALERHLRHAADIPRADLTDGGELHRLGQTAHQGHTAQDKLLSDSQRTTLTYRIRAHDLARNERDQLRDTVINAARVLATTAPDDPGRAEAEKTFATALPQAKNAAARLPVLARDAAEAQRALDADTAHRARQQRTITAGERADSKLRMLLRSRLTEALAAAEILPLWFTTALGPLPPATRAEAWMTTATDLLAYRVTYQVTDEAVALGPKPPPAPGRRATWHQQLVQAIGRHNA